MMWSDALESLGKLSEIAGFILSGREILSVRFRQIPIVLFQALWRGPAAQDAAHIANWFREDDDKVAILQGASFVLLGLVLQALPHLWEVIIAFRASL